VDLVGSICEQVERLPYDGGIDSDALLIRMEFGFWLEFAYELIFDSGQVSNPCLDVARGDRHFYWKKFIIPRTSLGSRGENWRGD
jgi:hypothetical protein